MAKNSIQVERLLLGAEEQKLKGDITASWDATAFVIHIPHAQTEEKIVLEWDKISALDLQHKLFKGSRLAIEPILSCRRLLPPELQKGPDKKDHVYVSLFVLYISLADAALLEEVIKSHRLERLVYTGIPGMLSEGVAAKYYSKTLRQLVTGLGYCLIFSFMLREIYLLVPEVLREKLYDFLYTITIAAVFYMKDTFLELVFPVLKDHPYISTLVSLPLLLITWPIIISMFIWSMTIIWGLVFFRVGMTAYIMYSTFRKYWRNGQMVWDLIGALTTVVTQVFRKRPKPRIISSEKKNE